jgi:hypothetical protein
MRLILLLLLLVAAVAGCARGDGPDAAGATEPAPDGFTRYTSVGYTFVHPSSWQVEESDGETRVLVRSPEEVAGEPLAVAVSIFEAELDLLLDVRSRNARASFPEFEVADERDVDVAEADRARRTDWTYGLPTPEGEPAVPYRRTEVYAEQDGMVLVFQVGGPAELADRHGDVLTTVIDSLALRR